MRIKRSYFLLLASGMVIFVYSFLNTELPTPWGQIFPSGNNLRYTEKKQTTTRNVIILTYMRCGSSLTGDIIQASPDVFYFFEPFHGLGRHLADLHTPRTVHYRDNKNITIQSRQDVFPLYVRTLKTILSCRFEDVDNITLQQTIMKRSKTTNPAFLCIRKNKTSEPQWQQLLRCHQTTNTNCRSARLRVVKTIRLGMQHVEAILSSDPTLKIIHLVRDPRAIINSRLDLKLKGEIIQYNHLCNQIMEDLEKSKEISKVFPSSILTVRYEDLAEAPIVASRHIYSFLGLKMTFLIEQYIWNTTHADVREFHSFGTLRQDATKTANAWRQKLDYQTILDIENTCTRLLELLGYRLFQSEDAVRNVNLSSTYKLKDTDLMTVSI